MAEPVGTAVRYTAFLSYSHKDSAAAARLHRRLESYRLPKRLAGSETTRGIVPERLWPIFRDREELPAATDLSETVREALAQSGALIVLCSPHSAGSLWVAAEIETFRRVHPDRPVLAAILDGDPPDCFPAALRAFGKDGTWHEPLATDLRRGRDGAQMGLLKLVAGITGVGLDALVQRDAARKVRRVMAVTGVALVGMLIMATMAVVAIEARRDAERNRTEVERQIEFMLTDLRERLKGVGRLDIMEAVNRHALSHYEGQDLTRLDPDALERRARLLRLIGADDQALGRYDRALIALREARATTGEQLGRDPDNPARIFAHAQNDFWIAEAHRARRQWALAKRHYSAYAEAGRRLVEIEPGNPDFIMEAGWGDLNMGIVSLQGDRNPGVAAAQFQSAIDRFVRVARMRRADRTVRGELANAHAWLADAALARRDFEGSLAGRRRELALRVELHRLEPSNMARIHDLGRAERAVARNASIQGDRQTAAPFFRSAHARFSALTRRDPNNQIWLLRKATLECDWLLGEPGRPRDLDDRRLRASIAAAGTQLDRWRNPHRQEIAPCLQDEGRQRRAHVRGDG